MGQVISNLKARFGADTSDLKKGLKDGEKAVDDFKGAAGNAVEKLADLFGVNMSAINSALDTTKKELNFLGQSFNAAAKGGNILALAMKVLKVALISTGVGALIVALGSLISYFKGTGEGADKFRVIMAQLRSVIDNLVDRLQTFGSGLVDIFSGKFKSGVEKIRGAFKDMGKEITEDIKLSKSLADSENDLYRMETELITSLEERRQKVEELRLAARDQKLSNEEQLAAQTRAMEITKGMIADEIALEKERLRIMQEKLRISATDPTREQLREIAEQEAKIDQLRASGSTRMRELIEFYNTLTNKVNAAAEAHKKLAEEAEKAWQKMLDQPPVIVPVVDLEAMKGQLAEVQGAVVGTMDKVDQQIGSMVEGSLENLAVGFGELLGELAIGQAGVDDFGKFLMSSLAEMSIQVGKLAIGIGISIEGIKTALRTMQPAAAIAAGIALVALGTAVKGALSSMASTGANASASGAYSGQGYSFDTRIPSAKAQPVTVAVSGELRLRGKDLYAAIEEEEKDRYSNT